MSDHPQYPTDPNNPYGGPAYAAAPATRGPRPSSVGLAVKLLWVAIGVFVLGGVVSFATTGSITDQMLQAGATSEQADAATAMAMVIGGVIVLVMAGIFVLLTVFVGKGANWARIVSTVLAAIGVLLTLSSLAGIGASDQPVVATVASLVQILLVLAAIVLLYRPESNAWFSAPR